MRAEVVQVVRDLAAHDSPRFTASYVAERAGVPTRTAKADLLALTTLGDLALRFEVTTPDGDPVAEYGATADIPAEHRSWSWHDGEAFDVTAELIWVWFVPTQRLLVDLEPSPLPKDMPGKPVAPVVAAGAARTPEDRLATFDGSTINVHAGGMLNVVMGDLSGDQLSEMSGTMVAGAHNQIADRGGAVASQGSVSATTGAHAHGQRVNYWRKGRGSSWPKVMAVVLTALLVLGAGMYALGATTEGSTTVVLGVVTGGLTALPIFSE